MERQKHLEQIKRLRTGIANIEFLEKRILFLKMEVTVDKTYEDELLNAQWLLVKEIENYTEIKDQFCKLTTI